MGGGDEGVESGGETEMVDVKESAIGRLVVSSSSDMEGNSCLTNPTYREW